MSKVWVRSLDWERPLKEGMATHSSIPAWKTHGQSSLEGCSPRGHKESDRTEQQRTCTLFFLEFSFRTVNDTTLNLGIWLSLQKECYRIQTSPIWLPVPGVWVWGRNSRKEHSWRTPLPMGRSRRDCPFPPPAHFSGPSLEAVPCWLLSLCFHSVAFPTAFTEIPPLWSIQIVSAKHPDWAR